MMDPILALMVGPWLVKRRPLSKNQPQIDRLGTLLQHEMLRMLYADDHDQPWSSSQRRSLEQSVHVSLQEPQIMFHETVWGRHFLEKEKLPVEIHKLGNIAVLQSRDSGDSRTYSVRSCGIQSISLCCYEYSLSYESVYSGHGEVGVRSIRRKQNDG